MYTLLRQHNKNTKKKKKILVSTHYFPFSANVPKLNLLFDKPNTRLIIYLILLFHLSNYQITFLFLFFKVKKKRRKIKEKKIKKNPFIFFPYLLPNRRRLSEDSSGFYRFFSLIEIWVLSDLQNIFFNFRYIFKLTSISSSVSFLFGILLSFCRSPFFCSLKP